MLLDDQFSASILSRRDIICMSYDFKMSTKEEKITFRDFKNIDLLSFENELVCIPWNIVFSMSTVEIQNLYNKYVMIKSKAVSGKVKPWFLRV